MSARALLLALLLCMQPAAAEQALRQDGFIVHYAALASTDIAAEVARKFGVRRGERRGLLVLNAQRDIAGAAMGTPIPAQAEGQARSLIGHVQKLKFRQLTEGRVHYTVAEFEYVDREVLTLDVQVRPEGAAQPLTLKLRQTFHTPD